AHLGERAGEAGTAQVLDAHHQVSGVDLQARLDQQLLGERVAHLYARPARPRAGPEGGAGQHGHPADAVPAGLRAGQDHLVARPGCRSSPATMRAPIASRSRTIPPTPVAATW